MQPIDLFIYDFDGTLIDSKLDIADSVNLALGEIGVRQLPQATIFGFIGRGVEHLLSQTLENTGYTDVAKATAAFKRHYDLHLLDQTDLFPHCRETVGFFRHKKNTIFSNKPVQFIRRILVELDFLQPFSIILGGDELEKQKPDPAGILHMIAEMKIPPQKTLMVGDSLLDIEAGKRAGVLTCAVTYGLTDRHTLQQAKPDYLIDDIAELRTLFH
jgi:phosphoglycolate phosphatase